MTEGMSTEFGNVYRDWNYSVVGTNHLQTESFAFLTTKSKPFCLQFVQLFIPLPNAFHQQTNLNCMKLSLHIDIRHIVIPRRQVSSHMNCHIRWFKDQLGGSYGFPISHHSSYYKKGKGLFHQTRVWHTFLTSSPSPSSKLSVYFWSSFFRVCLCHSLHNIIFHQA